MQFDNSPFPGLSTPDVTLSQRSYSYDPMGSLTIQSTRFHEFLGASADNMTYVTPFSIGRAQAQGGHGLMPQLHGPDGFIGNVELSKPGWFPQPGWVGGTGVGGINNNWDDLRQSGIGYGLYSPHLPQHPIPANKLYEPGSGFVLPATFLGQPLVAMASPPGS